MKDTPPQFKIGRSRDAEKVVIASFSYDELNKLRITFNIHSPITQEMEDIRQFHIQIGFNRFRKEARRIELNSGGKMRPIDPASLPHYKRSRWKETNLTSRNVKSDPLLEDLISDEKESNTSSPLPKRFPQEKKRRPVSTTPKTQPGESSPHRLKSPQCNGTLQDNLQRGTLHHAELLSKSGQVEDQESDIVDLRSVAKLAEYLSIFLHPDFELTSTYFEVGRLFECRTEPAIQFSIELGKSSVPLKPRQLSSEDTERRIWHRCLREPALVHELPLSSVRYQLWYEHENLSTLQHAQNAFETGYIINLLIRLAILCGHKICLSNTPDIPQLSLSRPDAVTHCAFEGDDKYLGFIARENGKFGSSCLYDKYSDESTPFDNDNEWYDNLKENP